MRDGVVPELFRGSFAGVPQVSNAYQTIENNAIVTDRINSLKQRYYRIDIVIGKMYLRRYAELFPEEV